MATLISPTVSSVSSYRIPPPTIPKLYFHNGCYIVLLIYCLANFSNGFYRTSFAPITYYIESQYNINSLDVEWLTFGSSLSFIICFYPITWIIEYTNLRTGVILGCVLNCIGCWIRSLGSDYVGYYLLIIGQVLIEIAQAFIVIMPSRLASIWFPFEFRALVCALCIVSSNFGYVLCYVLAPIVITDNSYVPNYLTAQAASATIVLLVVLLLFRSEPPARILKSAVQFPASPSRDNFTKLVDSDYSITLNNSLVLASLQPIGSPTEIQQIDDESLSDSIYRLLFDNDSDAFRWLTAGFGLTVGSSFALQAALPSFIGSVATNLDSRDLISLCNFYQIGRAGGTIGMLIIEGLTIDSYRRWHKFITIVFALCGCLFSCAYFIFFLLFRFSDNARTFCIINLFLYFSHIVSGSVSSSFWWIAFGIAYALMSACLNAVILGGFEWAARIQLRVSELVSASILFFSSQVVTVILYIGFNLTPVDITIKAGIAAFCCIIGTLCIIFVRDHDDDDDRCREQDRLSYGYTAYAGREKRKSLSIRRPSKADNVSPEPILSDRHYKPPTSTNNKINSQLSGSKNSKSTHNSPPKKRAFDFGVKKISK